MTTREEVRDDGRWQVGFFADDEEVVQVHVDGITGEAVETWTGIQVAWGMARGYEGQFGHALNAPWVWIPMALVFFFGLLDWRRPWRIVHLDLLVLLSFGVGHVFFNQGEIGVSAPLAYPPLLYLLGRMLWIGFRGGGADGGLRPSTPRMVLVVLCLFALAFRVTLNLVDSGVIDVGYAGVVGADRITQGEPIYGEGDLPRGRGPGRYVRVCELRGLRAVRAGAAMVGRVGLAAGGARRGALLRRRDGAGAVRAGAAGWRRRWSRPRARRRARLRLAHLPLHGLRAPVELERLAGRGASWCGGSWCSARRWGGECWSGSPRW